MESTTKKPELLTGYTLYVSDWNPSGVNDLYLFNEAGELLNVMSEATFGISMKPTHKYDSQLDSLDPIKDTLEPDDTEVYLMEVSLNQVLESLAVNPMKDIDEAVNDLNEFLLIRTDDIDEYIESYMESELSSDSPHAEYCMSFGYKEADPDDILKEIEEILDDIDSDVSSHVMSILNKMKEADNNPNRQSDHKTLFNFLEKHISHDSHDSIDMIEGSIFSSGYGGHEIEVDISEFSQYQRSKSDYFISKDSKTGLYDSEAYGSSYITHHMILNTESLLSDDLIKSHAELVLLDVCLSDYFQGHSNMTFCVEVTSDTTLSDILEEIESDCQEINDHSGFTYHDYYSAIQKFIKDSHDLSKKFDDTLEYSNDDYSNDDLDLESIYAYFSILVPKK